MNVEEKLNTSYPRKDSPTKKMNGLWPTNFPMPRTLLRPTTDPILLLPDLKKQWIFGILPISLIPPALVWSAFVLPLLLLHLSSQLLNSLPSTNNMLIQSSLVLWMSLLKRRVMSWLLFLFTISLFHFHHTSQLFHHVLSQHSMSTLKSSSFHYISSQYTLNASFPQS